MRNALAAVFFWCATLGSSAVGRAEEASPSKAIFAVIIGSNASVDAELPSLRYADDDAARYLDLFRLLGARTYLLSRLDENTARLHPQASAEALPPRRAELDRVLAQAAADIAQAHARGVETVLYFLYAGHGSVRNGQGYITLEDARLTGSDLATEVVGRVGADHVHFIVDACDSFLLAYPRGPGGTRRPVAAFEEVQKLAADGRVGLLLSSSSSRESHEWEGFQAGVFSHEVRSGLYGAADADGDGQISYREIAAFVSRANMAIPNERFRPQVHARAPASTQALLDLRPRMGRHVEIDGTHAGHYVLEDARGVRVADLHNAPGSSVRMLRPAPNGPEYLRRLDDDKEFLLPAGVPVVALADLEPEEPRVAARGAAHEAFNLVFTLPFDSQAVEAYAEPSFERPPARDTATQSRHVTSAASPLRRVVGWSSVGAGVAGVGVGVALSISAVTIAGGGSTLESQVATNERNDRVIAHNTGAAIGYVAGGAVVATGLVLLLWPHAPRGVAGGVSSTGASVQYELQF